MSILKRGSLWDRLGGKQLSLIKKYMTKTAIIIWIKIQEEKSLDQHKIHNKTFQATHFQVPADNNNLNGP